MGVVCCAAALLALLSMGAAPTRAADAVQPQLVANSLGMKLAFIPAGEFLMGSPAGEEGRTAEEKQHRVRISFPFYMGSYAVTQAEYQQVTGSNPSWFSLTGGGKDRVAGQDTSRYPVEQVSWNDAREFCRKLSRQEGQTYRLPTEAEWEYACRAGTTTQFHVGDVLAKPQANFGFALERTTGVGLYRPNAFGLYDMHGNVWQWCSDYYAGDYYTHCPVDNPQGSGTGSSRVVRGGSWDGGAVLCRSAFHADAEPTGRYYSVGFRVVRQR